MEHHHYQWVSQVEMGHLKHRCVSLLEGKGLFVRVANHRRFVWVLLSFPQKSGHLTSKKGSFLIVCAVNVVVLHSYKWLQLRIYFKYIND